jgi:hypothetical protein
MPTYGLPHDSFVRGDDPSFGDLSNILHETKFDIRARLKSAIEGLRTRACARDRRRPHECIQLLRKLLLVRGDTLLTKYSIFASASRSKVETLRQLLHRIPEQLLSVGDIGGPVLGGEVVGVVGDEL